METDGLTANVSSTPIVITTPEGSQTTGLEGQKGTGSQKCVQSVRKRLPVISWLPKYEKNFLTGDLIAGITVGLTAVPQVMAYALLAGLPPQYGLYSAFLPPFIYLIFGSCRQVTIGPTAIVALIACETCGNDFPECVILNTFYSGVLQLALSLSGLGSAVSLISEPVVVGFTAGAAITISSSQLKSFLGLSSFGGDGFIGYWTAIFSHLSDISMPDAILGAICVIFLIFFQKLGIIFKPSEQTLRGRILKKLFWLFGVSRNALVVFITSIIAYLWDPPPFRLTGSVVGGLPPFEFPSFLLPNRSYNSSLPEDATLSFTETWELLRFAPFVIALVAILQNVAISKIYGSGQRIDGNQEILALGISNIMGSFFSSQPVSGSFSRSAVNDASGVRTPFGGFFTGCLLIFSLGLLTSAFFYIPKASLAAVIICALMSLIEYETILPMWRISKIDFMICVVTFISALIFGMEYGIGIGVAISVLQLLYEYIGAVLVPEINADEETGLTMIILRPKQGLRFPGVDVVRKYVNKYALNYPTAKMIVLDCSHWNTLDYSAVSAIASLINSLKKNGKYLVLQNTEGQLWVTALRTAGVKDVELHCCWSGNGRDGSGDADNDSLAKFYRKSFPGDLL